ncbi:hypothetical protein N7G274_007327 [Stereocaulon virgatum]|uniref:Sister chromatid cohesion protein n=1 Tax=Stereocaulon virgatum TaxID=373712 RepID=A0ABR4A337_9LECA
MASPDHKAGLAAVVPATNQSPPHGKMRQHSFSSPRKPVFQSNGSISGHSSQQPNGMPPPSSPRHRDGISLPRQPTGTATPKQMNGVPCHRRLNEPGFWQSNGAVPARFRLLGVDEALKYSPFSSIVPFGSDIIPIPNVNLPNSQPLFPTPQEQQTARQPLDYLNDELSRTQGQSNVAQRARDDLMSYLSQDNITDFKFKAPKKPRGKQGIPQPAMNGINRKLSTRKIGSFGNMILNATDLSHRYPTPISPGRTSPKVKSEPSQAQPNGVPQPRVTPQPAESLQAPKSEEQTLQRQPPVTPTKQPFAENEVAHAQNSKILTNADYPSTPMQARPMPLVDVPPSSEKVLQSDVIKYEAPHGRDGEVSRKRKRDSESQLGASLSHTKDQRAASNETVRQLQDFIQDIFEAGDQSQADVLKATPLNTQYFVLASHEEREIPSLAASIHVRLESLLQKTTAVGRLGEIPVEKLQRLQGLCQGSLSSAESADLHIESEWSADDFTSWVQRLDAVDLGLRSARTILRMMIGGREEKQLYSEELLQSVLGVLKKALDRCITPVVESRSSDSSSATFEAASLHKKVISQLLYDTNKVMALLAKLLLKVDMAEMIITGIEYFATPLLFVENSHSEKESVLGIQRFESLRRTAMDIIAIIFARYPEQRLFLFDEILGSLQKLPVSRQHARQFRLVGGTSIQLVSALIMRLVQTSATQLTALTKMTSKRVSSPSEEGQVNRSDTSENEDDKSCTFEKVETSHDNTAIQTLSREADHRLDNAAKSAQYVVRYLVQRAMTSSKTGDQPHRQLLDIFVEDLISVLSLPEWPAAELTLRMLLASCRNIAENPKSLAPAKNMALELLGMMGSAISELVSNTRHIAKSLENDTSDFSDYIRQMFDDYTDGSLETSEIVMWNGPYHAVVEYLVSNSSDDPQIESAQGYYLARWAKAFASADLRPDAESDKQAGRLCKMLTGAGWCASSSLEALSNNQYRIAYALSLLTMDFCRQFDYILKILLDSVTSEQITVRTRSLKSVTQMLEKDPSILDRARSVKVLIVKCATDASSMVRDSALTLIGKCIVLRPALEGEFLGHVLRLSDDPAAGVRKRSMKLLKDIYLRNTDGNIKTAIGDSLLQRTRDLDTGVSDLARQTFEDIWLSRFWTFPDLVEASAQNNVAFREQTSLIVATVRRGEKVSALLVYLLKEVLSNNARNAAGNFKVCKSIVATAFDMIIDQSEGSERLEQRHILQTMTVLAKANARLFTPDQLQALQPYIANLSGKDDLDIFRSIVIVFRCVLPVLSNLQHNLLREIQKALLQSISKLGKAELDEVAECLWTINGTLQNPEMLLRLTISVLKNLRNLQNVAFGDPDKGDDLKRVKKYIQIAGYFGKHCDFESHDEAFKNALTWWKGGSVAGLIVQSIHPFTIEKQPISLRAEALDSIGLICQSWPYQYTQEHISNTFQDVLRKGEPELQSIVLSSFREFFARIDRQAEEKGAEALPGDSTIHEGKLGGSMTANDGDGASALIAQRFLKDTLGIALAGQNTSALAATEVIASINRQGLVHPKESGPALVALETSTNPAIADVAFQEHRLLHQQHESMFEREYMRAIHEAFRYQRDIVKDTLGYTKHPYASKLSGMFEIIKTSKGKYQKKFLSNYCSKIDFDVLKMDTTGNPPNTLQFSRFLIENLLFCDFGRLDELLHTISCMEKIVADTGSGIAHSISTEIFHLTVQSVSQDTSDQGSQLQGSIEPSQVAPVDPARLFQLTTAAIILSSLWEARSHIKRLYGLASQHKKDGKGKAAAKDLNKPPGRVQGVNGDKIVAAIAEKVSTLGTEELMFQQCKEFVDLMSVDNEVKVAADGEEDLERSETPSGDEERDAPMSGGSRGAKRKGSVSISGTPMKKKKVRPSLGRKKSGKSVDSHGEWD